MIQTCGLSLMVPDLMKAFLSVACDLIGGVENHRVSVSGFPPFIHLAGAPVANAHDGHF